MEVVLRYLVLIRSERYVPKAKQAIQAQFAILELVSDPQTVLYRHITRNELLRSAFRLRPSS